MKNFILFTFFYYFVMFLVLFLNHLLIIFIPAVIAQIFNPISELVIPIGIPSKEAKAEIESVSTQTLLCLLIISSFWSISLMK